jgi:hypothetical protein
MNTITVPRYDDLYQKNVYQLVKKRPMCENSDAGGPEKQSILFVWPKVLYSHGLLVLCPASSDLQSLTILNVQSSPTL